MQDGSGELNTTLLGKERRAKLGIKERFPLSQEDACFVGPWPFRALKCPKDNESRVRLCKSTCGLARCSSINREPSYFSKGIIFLEHEDVD